MQLAAALRAKTLNYIGRYTSDDAPICRWITTSVILDVMPTDAKILGFGNKWYVPAMANSETMQLPNGKEIRIVSAPYFLITKLEAFDGRGKGDYLASHDIEDIISVLDGRPEIVKEIKQSDSALTKELSERFKSLLQGTRFIDAVPGHMPTDETNQARVAIILDTMKNIEHNI